MTLDEFMYRMVAGLLILSIIIFIVNWILYGISHMKMLKIMEYENYWMAWLPLLHYYAIADCVMTVKLLNPKRVWNIQEQPDAFKFWWVLRILLPLVPGFGNLLELAVSIACRGYCYNYIFSVTDGKSADDTKILAYLSGWLPIIAIVKYLFRKDGIRNNGNYNSYYISEQ